MNTLNACFVSLCKASLILYTAVALAAEPIGGLAPGSPVVQGLNRMYNFDFPGANRILESHISASPDDPLGPTFRAASDLFSELDRLAILEGEFFSDDKRIAAKKGMKPDPVVRERLFRNIGIARQKAAARLAKNDKDADALFAQCITAGLELDYAGLVEKKQLASFGYLKEAHRYAVRLLAVDPNYVDGYMTTGLSEYLIGSLPFFVRWFVKFDQTEGNKQTAVTKLERVVRGGRYLGPFAKILLSIIHLREKRYVDSSRLLAELNRDFPENPLYRKELAKLQQEMKKGGVAASVTGH